LARDTDRSYRCRIAGLWKARENLAALLWGGRSLADAQRSGTMTIEGDKAAVERFVRLFPMPEPAAAVTPA
jgi:hypothetical protein